MDSNPSTALSLERVGLAFARQFYEAIVNDTKDPFDMLDEETVYTTGQGEAVPSQRSVVGRAKINLDLELAVFRGKHLKLTFVDTQPTFDEGLLVLVSGAAVDTSGAAAGSHDFVQTFLLGKDPLEGGFFIRNTVVRFLSSAAAPTPAAPAASAVPATTPAASAAPTPAPAPKDAPSATAAAPAMHATSSDAPAATAAPASTASTSAKKEGKRSRKAKEGAKDSAAVASKDAGKEEASEGTKGDGKRAAAPAPSAGPVTSYSDALRRPAAKVERKPQPKAAVARSTGGGAAVTTGGGAGGAGKAGHHQNGTNGRHHAGEKGSHINANAQCYVSNISFNTSNADLEALLSKYGAVKNIMRPVNKGYGFVEYESNSDAKKAIGNVGSHDLTLDGRVLKIETRTGQGTGTPAPTKSEKRGPPRRERESRKPKP